jgi:hypothetical protein
VLGQNRGRRLVIGGRFFEENCALRFRDLGFRNGRKRGLKYRQQPRVAKRKLDFQGDRIREGFSGKSDAVEEVSGQTFEFTDRRRRSGEMRS